jgi:hypothetical protein
MVLNRRNCSLLGKLGALVVWAPSGRTEKIKRNDKGTLEKKLGI